MSNYVWLYEVISNETGEVFEVSSMHYLHEFMSFYHYRYVTIQGYYLPDDKIFYKWD